MRFGCFGLVKDIEAIAQAGFDFIELNLREIIELSEEEFQNVLSRLKSCKLDADAISWILPTDLDLTAEQTHYEDWQGYIATGISRALAMGAHIWPIGSGKGRSMKPGNGTHEAQKQRVHAFFSKLAAQAAEAGILVLIEPLGPDFSNYLQTLEDTVSFVKSLPCENVKTMCDLRHLIAAGVPLSDIITCKDLIGHAHIDIPTGKLRRFPRKEDGYDYTPYFRILNQIGITRLSVEALHEDSLLDGKESIAYMKELLAATREEIQ